jgi:hypothetical protein
MEGVVDMKAVGVNRGNGPPGQVVDHGGGRFRWRRGLYKTVAGSQEQFAARKSFTILGPVIPAAFFELL